MNRDSALYDSRRVVVESLARVNPEIDSRDEQFRRDHAKNLQELENEFRGRPIAEIEAKIKDFDSVRGADQRNLLRRLAEEQRAAADKPAQERWEKTYKQTERHHRVAVISMVISVAAALAAAVSAWFAWHPPQQRTAPSLAPPLVASPSPTSDGQ